MMEYLILRPENATFTNLFRYAFFSSDDDDSQFLTTSSSSMGPTSPHDHDDHDDDDHRWVILFSILVRKIITFFAIPIHSTGRFLEYLLNLLSHNGGSFITLIHNFIRHKVVIPQKGTTTFMSTIGHLDPRLHLQMCSNPSASSLMELCIMSSKLAYENSQLIQYTVNHHWNMHFLHFYDCLNHFQKQLSTQLFILCDKPKDANFILVSFRGTEPFDADDWCTDFDYSWYQIPNVGKIHMGFLEALGLGNREQPSTFYSNLQNKHTNHDSTIIHQEKTAYYILKSKLKSLLKEHKDAKFIITGHSLGGALAILFPTVLLVHEEMEIMERLLGVYTFGQPRIGNRQLGRFMEPHLNIPVPKYFRVVYCNDIVPRLPYDDKTFLYKHFGDCLYYNSLYIEKNVKEEPNRNFFGMRFVLSQHLNAVWELIRGLIMGYVKGAEYKEGWFRILLRIIGLVLPGFSAHCATDYVNSIRLGKENSIHMSSI